MKTLYPHQNAAIDSLFDWFNHSPNLKPLLVAPVGAGKSLIMAEFIKRVHGIAPRTKIVVLTHVQELLEQNYAELKEQYPAVDAGFYCAGLKQRKTHNDVIFASIQSVHNKILRFNTIPQIILIDECHLISQNDATQYRKFIDSVLALNANCKVIGLTGTPFRADSGRLDEGENRLFDGVAYEIEINYLIENGYLCRPFTPKTNTVLNVEGVGSRGGDYIAGQLEAAVDIDETTQSCVQEILQHGAGRNKWLIFTAGVTHCEHVRDAIRAHGVTCEMVTGKTPKDERAAIIAKYKAGEIKCLVNVAVLTTGFNVPSIDMLVFMRPTRSPVLYIQCVGRGLRNAPNKTDCMVLDFGNVVATLGAIDTIDIRKKPKKAGDDTQVKDAITKRCPACGALCMPQQRYCYECSYSFINESLENKASDKHMLSSDAPINDMEVIGMDLAVHFKRGDDQAPPTLRVTYYGLGESYSEWICFEHKGFAYDKACAWHNKRLPNYPMPQSVGDARQLPYPMPASIKWRQEGKYTRILEVAVEPDLSEPPTLLNDVETMEVDLW